MDFTIRQVSEMFGVTVVTVYNWKTKGIGNWYKVGGKWFCKRESIEELKNPKRMEGNSQGKSIIIENRKKVK